MISTAHFKDTIINGVLRCIGKIYASEFIGKLTGNADTSTKATQDESGNNIKASYASSISISDHTITLKNKNGASLGTVTVPDNNTTYSAGTGISLSGTTFSNSGVRSISTGSTNGTISVNTNGTSANVAVKGLGSAAYTASSAYAAASHTHSGYLSSTNPTGSGYVSIGRLTDSTVGSYSVAIGWNNTASGYYSVAMGRCATALQNQFSYGHYNNTTTAKFNDISGASTGTVFVLGNGTSTSASNAFRITGTGVVYSAGAYNTSGADYAEFLYEWEDKNIDNEDRRGYFVTVENKKIRKATSTDYIAGIVSANPCIVGNSDEQWLGRYMFDDFGSIIYEDREDIEEYIDDETGEEKTRPITITFYKENPDYDPSQPYIHRIDRPEWDYIGFVGVLPIRDDGTCVPDGYCKCTDDGTATSATVDEFMKNKFVYRVLERVNNNIVKVLLI